jgi:TRAP-type C4-dicarboxylate transport system permease small subunit
MDGGIPARPPGFYFGGIDMPKIFTTLDKIKPAYDITYKVVLVVCKLLLIADILITTISVLGRYIPFIPDPSWSEEMVLTCMSYMAVLSAALAIRRGAHIRMTAFDVYLPKVVVKTLDLVADLAVMVLGIIMLVVGWKYASTLGGRGFYVSMPWLSRFWMYFPVPLAGGAMIIFEIESIYNHIKSFFVKEEK